MSRLVVFLFVVVCTMVPACQCSDKPEIGPVEPDGASAMVSDVPSRTLIA